MKELFPIYVPSKGRPDSFTMQLLEKHLIPYTAVLEPQDGFAYRAFSPKYCVQEILPENDKGIAYVRNYILNLTRGFGHKWFWMLDDDIKGFFLTRDGKTVKSDPKEVLLEAQRVFTNIGKYLGQGALEYQQFAWSAKKDHVLNSYCDVAVCINVENTQWVGYRPEMELKEDRDFTLQILKAGFLTARASKCSFSAPKNGSNKGGLYDAYRSNREAAASQRMVKEWPKVCTLNTKKDGRPDVKINWKLFKPRS
jgi:hypothetical protein